MRGTYTSSLVAALLIATLGGVGACEAEPSRELPTEAVLDSVYGERVDISLNGNVVELAVTQDSDQLSRGGSVWAKAGPYIFLFTPQTRELLEAYGGIGGVRVTTLDANGRLVARALLERGTLNSVTWPRAINAAGRARVEGTQRPQTMVDLADFGEEHTSYEYSQRYVRSP
ncbi:MAG TPA: hypothetical protein VLA33_10500 [Gemmatimonadota bacterium]|nr:hypothetical protein [Gemmatimonadota bacterium]